MPLFVVFNQLNTVNRGYKMSTLIQDIKGFKIRNFKNTALLIAKRDKRFNELYYSSNILDIIQANSMLCDLMVAGKHIIDSEIKNQGRY